MGPPNASAAVMPIAHPRRASPVCLPRIQGARHFFFFPPRARGAWRVSARREALGAARRTVLPVMRPVAHDGALPVMRPGAHGGFIARRGAPRARARPSRRPS
ncbi:unnamed protein product [Closterium sp. NIES-54]